MTGKRSVRSAGDVGDVAPARPARQVALRVCFGDPLLAVMNLLNEVVLDYPDAISFAPGRPLESSFDVERQVARVEAFVSHRAERLQIDRARAWQDLGQYNRTNGFIADYIARHLAIDEHIHVSSDSIMVTVGAQEAMAVVLLGLFEPERDVLLVSDPTYVGIGGFARLIGTPLLPVPAGPSGLEPDAVERAIRSVSSPRRPRALYDIPDFNNPLGTTLSVERRRGLIDVCRRHDVLIIEDNPYGMFAYDDEPLPTLKALDADASVLYIGSFSKTLFPSLRLGYLVADQRVQGSGALLARELSCVKSFTTVNTPAISQAIAAGILLESASLRALVEPQRLRMRANRDALVAALEREGAGIEGLSWNRPRGGFFATVTVPFAFGVDEMRRCAADYGVIVCPMQCFSLLGDRDREVRLSFSYVLPPQIDDGISRFVRFIRDRER